MRPFDPLLSDGETEEPHRYVGRTVLARLFLVLVFGAISLQLWRLQVVEGRAHRTAAEDNSLRVVSVPALRGVIYDRNMVPVAVNAPAFAVTVTEADLPSARRRQILTDVASILGSSVEEIDQALNKKNRDASPFTPVVVKEQVPRETALRLEERSWALPGVSVRVATVREHVDSEILSHLLGYMALPSAEEYAQRYRAEGYAADERVGGSGVEHLYEKVLHGRAGARATVTDVAGRQLRVIQERPPEPGQGVVLTIDLELQRAATRVLRDRIEPGSSGVVIIMDPRNAEILAMVSLPGFDSNAFAAPGKEREIADLLSDPMLPLFNRAISGQYPPGSTFKLVTGIGALEERLVNRGTTIDCTGGLTIPNPYGGPGTFLPDWGVMGKLDFVQGLAQSCNVYFYTLGGGFGDIEGLHSDRLGRYARLLGYGESTGIDLPSEAAGRVPTAEWKLANFHEQWRPGDTYNMAIGQGFVLATPLQVANLTSGLAQGGVFRQPHVVRAVLDSEGQVHQAATQPARRVALREDTLAAIREGMIGVLETPQTHAHQVPEFKVAGKTGTAEYPGPKDEKGIGPTHGWFTAYAPWDRPSVSITVFVERGGGPGTALPLAMEVFREYFARYNP